LLFFNLKKSDIKKGGAGKRNWGRHEDDLRHSETTPVEESSG
jgi:hypothetical protein